MRALVAVFVLVPCVAMADAPAATTDRSAPARINRYVGTTMAPPGTWRLMLSSLSVIRVNPIGLEARTRFGVQKRLYPSDNQVSQNNFMFFGVYSKLNPASTHLAVGGEIQPVSIVNVKATVELQKYFGTFGFLQSFRSPDLNYSDAALDALESTAGSKPQSTTAFHAALAPLLQLKFGPIAVRTLAQLDYWDFALRDGDTVAYEATFDTLLPDRGFTLSTDTDLLYTGRPGLAVGLRHSWVHPLYKARHFNDPDLSATENAEEFDAFGGKNAHQRLGVFAAFTLRDRGPTKFNKPTIVLIASWYLSHRFRTGAPDVMRPNEVADDFTSRAIPYLLLGFAFESDLLATR